MTDRSLIIGAGHSRERKVSFVHKGEYYTKWPGEVVTMDLVPEADVAHDLNSFPWPFVDDEFDEVHAYEVLEHLGRQGNAVEFFSLFGQIWRVLKPGGFFAATVPDYRSPWAWGDPSHTRVITEGSLTFLRRPAYAQLGITPMSDFRRLVTWYGLDFDHVAANADPGRLLTFVLQAVKPARVIPEPGTAKIENGRVIV